MARYTIDRALRQMRRLAYADAGRLVGVGLDGVGLDGAWRVPAAQAGTPGWPPQLNELLAARTAGTITVDTPAYLVLSDGLPVCWLTVDGVVITPDVELSRNQEKHQQWATTALGDLRRPVLRGLANRRDVRDGRPDDVDGGHRPVGALRVANPAEPALAWWVCISGDLAAARRRIVDVAGTDQPLIIAVYGYGRYGRDAHRPQLDVLCAIHRAAAVHGLPVGVVGDWLAAEGGLTATLDAEDVKAAFDDAYLGRFRHQLAYTEHRLDELGWDKALRELGASKFFDSRAFDLHLFSNEVRAFGVDATAGGGIIVCRRHRPT